MSQSTAIPTVRIKEWRRQVMERSADSPLDARIQCPLWGNVSTPRESHEAGANPERAFMNCIGRVIGAREGLNTGKEKVTQHPCDWAAGGYFGTFHNGLQLLKEDGSPTWVFDSATEVES
jgi:hypothetical protein